MQGNQKGRGGTRLGSSWRCVLLGAAVLLSAPGADARVPEPPEPAIAETLEFAASRLRDTAESLPPTAYPQETRADGTWITTDPTPFTSGFFAGSLWYMYEHTRDPYWRTQAERWQAGLESQKFRTDDHDLGFMLFTSFGNAYRLTGEERFREVLLTAADSLSQRYHPELGYIRSRGDITDTAELDLIIDTMPNLELLFWAARNGGRPELREMAIRHALNTLESHVRPDGSSFQVAKFDIPSGLLKEQGKEQGCRYETVWSRGQSWAIYGYTIAYRETGDRRFLDAARETADFYITHAPGDLVAYWDFFPPDIGAPRDSSAAAVTASALVELSQLEPDSKRARSYWNAARDILVSLSSAAYLSEGTPFQSILRRGTAFRPRGRSDIGLVYADYYFIEALLRYEAAARRSGVAAMRGVKLPPPLIAERSPMPDAPVVSVGADVKVLFTGDVRGVDARTMLLKRGGSRVEARVTYDAATRTATLDPVEPLRPDTTYTVKLDCDIRGPDGRKIDSIQWKFTTEEAFPRSARRRFIDFESGRLSEVDAVEGPVELVREGALRGTASARIPGVAPAWMELYFPDADEVFTSFLMRMNTVPAADASLMSLADDGEVMTYVRLQPNRALQLRRGVSNIGPRSNFLDVGGVYALSLRERDEPGPWSIVDFSISGPGSTFECPFASSRLRKAEPTVNRLRLGATEAPLDVTLDDVRLDTAR